MNKVPWFDEAEVPAHAVTVFRPKQTRFCVVIPLLNEGERIRVQLQRMHTQGVMDAADVIIADGGSSDGSVAPENLQAVGVRTLLTKQAAGRLGTQLRMAYAYALREDYEGIVTIDGNNKDSTESIFEFLRELAAGTDFVQGSRFVPGGQAVNTPWIRHAAIRAIHVPVCRVASGFAWTDTTSGYRAYSRRLLTDPRLQPFRAVFANYELLCYMTIRAPQLGFRVREIPVCRRYPESGKTPTKISFLRGNLDLLRTLFRAAVGGYNVP